MAKLGEYAEFIMGQAPSGKDCNTEGKGIPFVKAGQFTEEGTPIIDEWTINPLKMATDNDVLICVVGATSGKLNRGIECAIGRSVAAIRPSNDCLREYIYYGLQPWVQRIRNQAQGSAIGVITKDMLYDMDMPFPEICEQQKIVEIISKVENVIKSRKLELGQLDLLVRARFIEQFHKQGFPEYELAEVCSKITDGTHKTPLYQDSGIVFISAKNIVDGKLDYADVKYISESEYEEIQKRCGTEQGDLLLSKSGTLGTVALFEDSFPVGLFESLAVIKYKRGILNGNFLRQQLQSTIVQQQFAAGIKGVAVKHLHLNVIGKVKVVVPSLPLQERFAAFVQQTDKSKLLQFQTIKNITKGGVSP